jgi:hypothetical protein
MQGVISVVLAYKKVKSEVFKIILLPDFQPYRLSYSLLPQNTLKVLNLESEIRISENSLGR